MTVKMKDVARIAGVSQPTVSAVLRNKEYCYVSQAKKDLIIETARRMGYVPNINSRALRGLPTMTIGISSSLFTIPIHTELISVITKEIWNNGYQTLFSDSCSDKEKEKHMIREFLSRGVDGLILGCLWTQSEIDKLLPPKFPCVVVKSNIEGDCDCPMVYVDRQKGAYIAVEHLISHGHKSICFATQNLSLNANKFKGYKEAMKSVDAGNEGCVILEEENEEKLLAKAADLAKKKCVTAFLAANDFIASSLIKYFQENGIKIPQEIAVIGFDGLPWGKYMTPPLTTIGQPVAEAARRAVAMLMEKIKIPDNISAQVSVVEPELIIRESCGCMKK